MTQSHANEVGANTWAFVVITSLATLLRIYCRGWVIKAFSTDDWLAVLSQILFIIFCAYEITGVYYGTGRHFADIPEENIPKAMQMWWTCEPLYVLCNMAIKASIAIFLLRVCVLKVHKMIIWTVLTVTEIYSFFFFLLFVLQCRPTSLFWLRYTDSPPEGQCLDPSVVAKAFYAYSAISCWTDWTFSILPVFLVWKLQMSTKVKISVVCILATGAIASSATIVRFPFLYSLTDTGDFLYSTSNVAIWSTVETGLGITAAGVATLRPLLRTFFPGSSAPGHGTSARGWHKTGSGCPPGDELQLRDNAGRGMGVTTIIDHGKLAGIDLERQKGKGGDDGSENSDSGLEDWNTSQSNLAKHDLSPTTAQNGAWNITVQRSIVQTRGEGAGEAL